MKAEVIIGIAVLAALIIIMVANDIADIIRTRHKDEEHNID